jgi:hypothetical protein
VARPPVQRVVVRLLVRLVVLSVWLPPRGLHGLGRRARLRLMPLAAPPRTQPGKTGQGRQMSQVAATAETTDARRARARTYGNWRRPTSPGLLGLGASGTGALVIGMLMTVVLIMTVGLLEATLFAGVLGALILALTIRDVHNRNLLQRIGARFGWWSTRSAGSHLYRSGPLGRTGWGTYQLPGIVAATRLTEHRDGYDRPFAMLYTAKTLSYSIVIGAEPDGAALVDEQQIDTWVADWGHWLRNLGDEPGIEAASVTIDTAPDTGLRLRREVELSIDPDANDYSKALLREVVDRYPAGSSVVKAYIALTFSGKAGAGKRRDPDEMARELAARLPGLTGDLQATGAGAASLIDAEELCEAIRVAYDPAAAVLIDEAHASGDPIELSWADVGPTAAEASWGGYRHDSGWSRTWAMTSAPRGLVQAGVLARLLAPHRDIARKRVTLLYQPIDPGRAAALVESDQRAAEFQATNRRRAAARDSLAVRAAAATAAEEAAGAGLVNFGMLVTATVLDPGRMKDAAAAIDNLAATARVRLRPVYGSQDSAFAAALPLGLTLAKHVTVPDMLREKL